MSENEPMITLDSSGAHIESDAVFEKISKKNISPSMITGLEGCHARWVSETFVIRDIIEDEPDNAGRRGNLFHTVMEDFFALPPEERTKAVMKETVKNVLESEQFNDLKNNPNTVQWLRSAVNGYYSMGGTPEKVKIADLKLEGKRKKGLEVFVKGHIGDSSRPVLGFIDQVLEDPTRDDGSVIVADWKTSAKSKHYKPNNKTNSGLAEQRQQVIYAELLRQQGVNVSGARLVYPIARDVVPVDLGDEDLRNTVIRNVEETDKTLNHLIETNTFEYEPGFLCAWCPISKICPKADIKPYDKMQEAYSKQPGIEELAKGFESI